MHIIPKRISTVALLSLLLIGSAISTASAKPVFKSDPTDELKIREVLVSQQLFVTKFSPAKGKASKGKKLVNFSAELKGVFMVVYMDNDTTYTVTDWIRCPEAGCPAMKTYNYGTAEYRKLDTMITISKKNSVALQKRFAGLVASKR
ncbi:hypothetical protein [Mucilaginibacter myungsuensis]|uniref:Uncharacterized protein n=1 Tax=Mucilaginibacter myungsuensis TaxID=649104 RepID=A0A929L566_9SPHI|nr:hypothetical protein [Mucilaginibacter myungsuensis]MBE9663421.1 hypothetical protein [Mucilaginibacter myungsuensis]MDN3600157.1 hypothetical protein [Mucilaginibacter myungsuensis]